ncbi:unnamed protein product [Cylicocyclus nassatus]|uniref:Receptor expression-enhancing protein n=1 Tax=Cylicocyclus nassatus TaxID=53992 RepID=A0AA36H5U7_CYLNA|nr:unnamed protein product [Cylicocyclus nassatus]
MASCGDILHDRIHNEKWFTARGLKAISDASGWQVESVAKLVALLLLFLLTRNSNWLVCNTILVAIPMLLTFQYPDEKPSSESMRIYWISAFVMTAFDRMLEAFPFYYVMKLSTLLFLLVEPSCLNDNIKNLLMVTVTSSKPTIRPASIEEKDVITAKSTPAALWSIVESLKSAIAPSSPKGGESLRGRVPPRKSVENPRQSQPPALKNEENVNKSGSKESTESKSGSKESAEGAQKSNTDKPNKSKKTTVPLQGRALSFGSSVAPSPYETGPLAAMPKPKLSSGESIGRASVASGPPVAVGEKRSVTSTYVNIPKPSGGRGSLRVLRRAKKSPQMKK